MNYKERRKRQKMWENLINISLWVFCIFGITVLIGTMILALEYGVYIK